MTSIIIRGSPIGGFYFMGPFENDRAASTYARDNFGLYRWWVVELAEPEDNVAEAKVADAAETNAALAPRVFHTGSMGAADALTLACRVLRPRAANRKEALALWTLASIRDQQGCEHLGSDRLTDVIDVAVFG